MSKGTTIPILNVEMPPGSIQVVVPPRPAFVSQKTSESALGIPSEQFLEMLRRVHFSLPVVAVGKLRLVETEPLIAFMRKCAGTIQL